MNSKIFALSATLLCALPFSTFAANSGPKPSPPHSQLILESMPESTIVHRRITTWVFLPQGYNDAQNKSKRYPVIYLLHGQPGGWTDAYRSGRLDEMADKLIADGEMPPSIMVAFDGNGPEGLGDMTNFCNRVDGYRTEDFIVNGLVPYMDAAYRTIPNADHRALWGYSSGGYGALNLGFKHPDVFHVLASQAGFYQPQDDKVLMIRVLGKPGDGRWEANDPTLTVQTLPPNTHLKVYMDASPNEDDYAGFQSIAASLKARGANVETHSLDKAHAWRLIVNRSRDALIFIGKSFGGS